MAEEADRGAEALLKPSYYYPWDPLKLSKAVDGPQRVVKQEVVLPLAKGWRHRLLWSPLTHRNALVFAPTEDLLPFLTNSLRRVRKRVKESLELAYYTFGEEEDFQQALLQLEEDHPFFTYHLLEGDLLKFLQDLLAHRKSIREKTRALGHLEAPNKWVQVVLLRLHEEHCRELARNTLLRNMVLSLLQDSWSERIYLIPLFETAEGVSEALLAATTQALFLGEEGDRARFQLYPGLAVSRNNFFEEVIGFAWEGEPSWLRPLHSLERVQTAWGARQVAARAEEERLYREYLALLAREDAEAEAAAGG